MRPRMPSPAMVVALVALFISLSGTAVAVVGYASNADAVDGRSAVRATASLREAAGKLVATTEHGAARGRIPGRFVHDVMRGGATSVTRYLRAADNQPGPIVALATIPGIGRLSGQCRDQDPTAGIESTQTVITFTATEAGGANVSRLLGRDIEGGRTPVVFGARKGVPVLVFNFADPMFQLVLQAGERTAFVSGSARSDRNGTANAACLIFGIGLRVSG